MDELDFANMSDEEISSLNFEKIQPEDSEKQEETPVEEAKEPESEVSEPESTEEEPEEAVSETIYDEEGSETPKEVPQEPQTDYKSEYEALLAPFKASGRDIKVNSVEDARRLMQMGVDYNRKMQALKPHLRIMKALEKHNLLDEGKINRLIDLERKDPAAIAAFLKEKGIDPIEIDTSTEVGYQPTSHAPTSEEMNLNEVLDSIRDTSAYSRTMEELGNKWDNTSKEVFVKHPQLISVINNHVETGIYDQIMGIVETERVLGRLVGLSDLEAYKQVGDALQQRGAFKTQTAERKAEPGKSPQSDVQRDARRKAAQPTRSTPTASKQLPNVNPLALSDEEFEQVYRKTFRG